MKLTARILIPILAVSLSQIARAAAFSSVATGNWSNPSSWNPASGFPDTYAGDSVTINSGHVINYNDIGGGVGPMSTPAGLIGAGGFAISGGRSVLIAGGTLTQTTLNQEMRVGEGTGGAGQGVLTIQAGGTLDTGASLGLAVGTKISGAQAGNGKLDIIDGLLKLGAGAAAGGLGVGVDASTGLLNVGDGVGSAGSAAVDLFTNDVQLAIGANPTGLGGGTGTVTIASDGLLNFKTKTIYVGEGAGSTGTLNNAGVLGTAGTTSGQVRIGGGGGMGTFSMTNGTLNTTGEFNIGSDAGSTGAGTVSGGAVSAGVINVGRDGGSGTLGLSAGSLTTSGDFRVALGAGASGTFTQTGGAVNVNGNHLQIAEGNGTTGTFNLTAGTVSNSSWIHIGSGSGSTGTLNVNFTNPADVLTTGAVYLGNNSGTGFANVSNGSLRATGVVEVGRYGGTGTLTVSGPNSSVEGFTGGALDQFFRVGMVGGHGIANVSGGGKINTNGGWFTLGENNGSVGEATFSGAGTTLTSRGLIVGWNGLATGTLNITDNAVVTNTVHELSVGRDAGGANSPTGIINISSGGVLNAGPETRIGHNAKGVVNINGGTINMQGGGWAILGEGGAANGTLTMTAGAVNVTADRFVLGQNAGAVGTFNQTGGATQVGNEFNVGRGGATGSLNLEGGTFNVHGWTTIGRDGAGTGTINVKNTGVFTHSELGGDLLVGWNGGSTGNVNITAGGRMTYNWWIRMGIDPGSNGELKVDGAGSILNHNNGTGGDSRLVTGEAGTGKLTVSNGGQIVDGGNGFFVGWHNGSHGTAKVNSGGGVAVNNGWVQVGIETGSNGSLTVDGAGSLFTHDSVSAGHSTSIGQSGTGSLTISNGGRYEDAGSRFLVGRDNGGNGTLTVSGGSILLHTPAVDPNNEDWMMVIGGTPEASQPVGGIGLMLVTGGSAVQTNSIDIGRRSPGGGILNLTNSAMTVSGHFSTGRGTNGVGGSTNGLVNLTNGTLQYGSWLSVGHEGGSGVLNITNSTITGSGDFNVGIDQNGAPTPTVGVVNMNGGSVTVPTMPIGRNGGTGTFQLNSGTVTVNNEVNIGNGGSTAGTLNISGPASSFTTGPTDGNPHFFVGRGGGHGIVNVTNFGQLNTTNAWFALGNGDGSLGEATVSGVGSTLNSDGLIVGWSGSGAGTLTISNNAVVTNINRELSVGRDHANTSGIVTINTGGTLNTVEARIGHNGIGIVNINGGNFHGTSGWAFVGTEATSHGTVNMSGASTATFSDQLLVGHNGGQGVYNQTGGTTTVASEFNLGRTGGNGTLNLSGGTFNVNGWTTAGKDGGSGTGTINITNGALFNHPQHGGDLLLGWTNGSTGKLNVNTGGRMVYNWWFRVGVDPGSQGDVVVDGPGSSISVDTGRVYIGEKSRGTLTISNGGSFTHTNADEFNVGGEHDSAAPEGGDGTVTVTGAGSTLSVNSFIRVGLRNTGADPGVGVMNVTTGGLVSSGGWIGIGHEGGDGTLNLGGGTLTAGSEFYVGIDDNGRARTTTGRANITAGTISAGTTVWIGRNGGNGTVTISGAAAASLTSSSEMFIGDGGVGSGGNQTQGTLNISNPNAVVSAVNQLVVGRNGGLGTVNQAAGSVIETNQWVTLAANAGSTGTYNLSGGTLTSNFMEIGADGSGTLTVSGTGQATANQYTVGTRATGAGVVNVIGPGAVTSTGNVFLGGDQGAGSGTVNQVGGTISVGNVLFIGHLGTGVVNKSGGTLTAAEIHLQENAGATGILQADGGTIQTKFLTFVNPGAGLVNLNGATLKASQNEGDFLRNFTTANSEVQAGGAIFDTNGFSVTVNNQFDGVGGLVKGGSGKLTITAANLYAGGTIINTGTVNINADAALGNVLGGVTINNNATLQVAVNVTTNRTITLGAGGGKIDTNGQVVTLGTGSTLTGTALTVADAAGGGVLNIKGTGPQPLSALTTMGGVTNLYSVLGSGTSTITAAATLNIYASQTLASLTIADGVEVTFGDGTPFAPEPVKPSAPFGGGGAGLVPEPGSLGLLMVGALGFIARRRRGPQSR